ncbi:MAG TPA: peptidoglycan bridge formation glycyltransferase FemA/FemB family protein, partial [Patescibacteria group bacterium]|nr:peptidoglycan bridge formation glycyltransferase FemA/FemB family protein [Patescibacteria group bacterium]
MNLRFDEVKDRSAWELFVVRHAPQSLFQSWLWGEVQRKLGLEVGRFGLYEGEALRGIAQTIRVPARRGSFLHVRHGPIIDSLDPVLWVYVSDRLCEQAKRKDCLFVRISPLITQALPLRTVPSAIHR